MAFLDYDGLSYFYDKIKRVFIKGPAYAIDENIPMYDGTNGKLLQDSGIAAADIATKTYTDTAVAESTGDLIISLMLQEETIPDTTQAIVFDSKGNVSSITHQNESNNTVRADVFTFGENTVTEVRTLHTGETLTIVTNTDTLVTTVTYSAA